MLQTSHVLNKKFLVKSSLTTPDELLMYLIRILPWQVVMAVREKQIEVEHDFQGGIALSSSGVKNGLIAAVALGLLDRASAIEILLLIREATECLLQTMTD